MRELYREFFHIPKYGKVREKVVVTRIATTVLTIAVCLVAMCITAYAYFSSDIISPSNTIKAAYFEADISIVRNDNNGTPGQLERVGDAQVGNLPAGTYTIHLSKGNSTAATGYCIVTIGDAAYLTQQIGNDAKKDLTDATITFTLKLSATTPIAIKSNWGTSVYYASDNADNDPLYIQDSDCIEIEAPVTNSDYFPSDDNEPGSMTESTETTDEIKATESTETTETIESTEDPESA